MKHTLFPAGRTALAAALIVLSLAKLCASDVRPEAAAGSRIDFCEGRRFHLGDLKGAEQPAFADAGWRKLDLPHDWSIELPQDRTLKGGLVRRLFPRRCWLVSKELFVER